MLHGWRCHTEACEGHILIETVLCRPQSLILSPTRELAAQTTKTIQAMGEFMKVRAHTCVGGTSLGERYCTHLLPLLNTCTCCAPQTEPDSFLCWWQGSIYYAWKLRTTALGTYFVGCPCECAPSAFAESLAVGSTLSQAPTSHSPLYMNM